MGAKKPRPKQVLGCTLTSEDGRVWRWQVDSLYWTWCLVGQTRVRGEEGERIALFSPKVEGAVGYSLGFSDGADYSERTDAKMA